MVEVGELRWLRGVREARLANAAISPGLKPHKSPNFEVSFPVSSELERCSVEFAARAASLLLQAEVTSRSDVMQKSLHGSPCCVLFFFFPFFPRKWIFFRCSPRQGRTGLIFSMQNGSGGNKTRVFFMRAANCTSHTTREGFLGAGSGNFTPSPAGLLRCAV